MALNFEAKKAVVEQVNAVAIGAVSVGAAEYRGLNVEQMTNLRSAAIEADVSLRVVKNTLAKRALAETGCECILPVKWTGYFGFFPRRSGRCCARFS